MDKAMQQKTPQPDAISEKVWHGGLSGLTLFFACVGQREFAVPAANMVRLISDTAQQLIPLSGLRLSSFIDCWYRVPQNQNPFDQMVLDDLADGPPEERHLHVVSAAHVGNQELQTVWTMGHKIRQALAARDANYELAGLIEMDDTYFGAPKPGKRGRGAAGKAKVALAVEIPGR